MKKRTINDNEDLAVAIHTELGKVLLAELKAGDCKSQTMAVALNYAKSLKIESDADINPYMRDILKEMPFGSGKPN